MSPTKGQKITLGGVVLTVLGGVATQINWTSVNLGFIPDAEAQAAAVDKRVDGVEGRLDDHIQSTSSMFMAITEKIATNTAKVEANTKAVNDFKSSVDQLTREIRINGQGNFRPVSGG